jgi:isoleucyl-tRNA synthetase
MRRAHQVVTRGLAARHDAGIGVRQPLRRAVVTMPDTDGWADVAAVVADELNVKALQIPESSAETVTVRLRPNFRALGPIFGRDTPAVAGAISTAPAEEVAAALRSTGEATVDVDGRPVTVSSEQVQVLEEPRTGWTVASDAGYSVALDVTIDRTLRLEGLARELVRALNDLRRLLDLAIDRRITLRIDVDGDLAAAVDAHREAIAADVLAVDVEVGGVDGATGITVAGEPVRVAIQPVESPATSCDSCDCL